MRELFIYYRVRPDRADALRAAVFDWQAQLRQRFPGLRTRLLVRDDGAGPTQTWMETYTTDPQQRAQGIDAALQAAIEAEAEVRFAGLTDGARHSESFTPCA